jgi:hypothetical protein
MRSAEFKNDRCLPTPVMLGPPDGAADQVATLVRAWPTGLVVEVDPVTGIPLEVGAEILVEFRVPVELRLYAEVLAVDGTLALLEVTTLGDRFRNSFNAEEPQG